MNSIEHKFHLALLEIKRLKQENEKLRRELSQYQPTSSITENANTENKGSVLDDITISSVHNYSSPADKVELFRSLFKGREDVYPVRWENKAGRAGYSPACGNEWTVVCKKPQVKCSECSHQDFLSVTDEVISQHLDPRVNRTIGVYPMLPDETCWFLAMDFDKQTWREDASAVMTVCREHDIPAALERSRSGDGGHIWIFFMENIDAGMARKLGCAILTITMSRRYQVGLCSYDRLFPNQDTLPRGGFGNLIALPLQGVPRKKGNSVFVDDDFQPYEDQWKFLAQIKKIDRQQVMDFVQIAARSGNILNVGYVDSNTTEKIRGNSGNPPMPINESMGRCLRR
ncbi:TOTE conflict system archaeo-eukaryotic primase domain-containing protein [Paenibacillus sp. A14]|uniref:TOTE conflict system archaeo-eukaryotic primase domain-containing protein n=1 Tax=Paenibacillus sp. A14 TaxID=3119820 RepID=UPI002FE1E995